VNRIQNEDMSRCLKRLKDASRALDSLKRDIINEDSSVLLQTYIQKKDIELENSKVLLKSNHVNKINSMYHVDMENFRKTMVLSSEIIQDHYLLFRREMDEGMLGKLDTLVKLYQGQRNVKFEEGDIADSPTKNCPTYQNILNLSDYAENAELHSPSSTKKRPFNNDVTDDEEDGIEEIKKSKQEFDFVRPKAIKAIDFNAPMPAMKSNVCDLNVTFDLQPKPTKILSSTTNNARPAMASSSGAITKGS
jgi:hypothetical protein